MDFSQLTGNPLALACVAAGAVLLVMHYGGPALTALAAQVPHLPTAGPAEPSPVDAVIAAYRACAAHGRADACEILGRALQCVLTHPANAQGASNGPAK